MLRYAEMLHRELSARGYDIRIVHPPVVLGGIAFLPGPLKKWIGYVDKYVFGLRYLRKQVCNVDLIHVCDHSNAMYLQCAGNKPALITCHDLLAIFAARGVYPNVRTGFTGRVLQHWIAASLSRAKHVICVSKKSQDDLEVLFPDSRSRTRVIHHHLNWNYSQSPIDAITNAKKQSGLESEAEYFLHVGGNQWYKNRLGVMRIFAALRKYLRFKNVKLVMAGKPWTPEMRQYAASSELVNEMIERVEVSNEQLQALYSGAIALLFPSLEEGFGWPVLEAQACGCPVITSSRAPMTEIAGKAAFFIDPEDPENAAEMIADHISDLSVLSIAGFKNLARFTKDGMINAYIKFYEEVASKENLMALNNPSASRPITGK